jgi:hypothetical protein
MKKVFFNNNLNKLKFITNQKKQNGIISKRKHIKYNQMNHVRHYYSFNPYNGGSGGGGGDENELWLILIASLSIYFINKIK